MELHRWLAGGGAVFLLAAPCAARPLDLDHVQRPATLCRALAPYGLDAGNVWRESASRRGGWSCERNGAIRECGRVGAADPPGSLAYYVFGSGPRKVDRAILQLTMHAADSDLCRAQLRKLAGALSGVIGIMPSARIAELISTWRAAGEAASGAVTGRGIDRRALHEERQGWVHVRLTGEDSRLTVLTVSFVNPNASRVWD